MKAININKKWAEGITFSSFKKEPQVSKLDDKDQIRLFEEVTGRKVKQPKKKDQDSEQE